MRYVFLRAPVNRCLVSNASGCALFIPFKEEIFVQFHKDFPKKKAQVTNVFTVLGYQQICQTPVKDFVVVRNNKCIHSIAVGEKPAKVG